MPAQRSLFSRTMISLPLPAAVILFGTLGMAWASSNSPEVDPTRSDAPATSQSSRDDTSHSVRLRSGSDVVDYWTPKRMRDATPAGMVEGAAAPSAGQRVAGAAAP